MDRFMALVIGGTGAGKTELITGKDGYVSPAILDKCRAPIYVIDPMNEIPPGPDGVLYTGELDPTGEGHPGRAFRRCLSENITTDRRRHVFHFPTRSHAVSIEQGIDVLRILDGAQLPGTIYLEETDLFSSASTDAEPLENMIFRGRHARQSLIFSARRPARISKDILSQCLQHIVIMFRTVFQTDADRFSAVAPPETEISNLPDYRYVTGGQRAQTVPFASILDPYQEP